MPYSCQCKDRLKCSTGSAPGLKLEPKKLVLSLHAGLCWADLLLSVHVFSDLHNLRPHRAEGDKVR